MTSRVSIMRSSTRRKIGQENNDTTQKDIKQKIINRRIVFKSLPVLCSNDLVHGSWWMVWGSFLSMLISVVPLFHDEIPSFYNSSNTLSALKYTVTWVLLIISGFFFTLGSLAYVRAVEEPHPTPLFSWEHISTDELLASWLFFVGVLPSIPYSLVFLSNDPSNLTYIGMLVISIVFCACTFLFVMACYPKEEKAIFDYAKRVLIYFGCGCGGFIDMHFYNDWLAGCWLILFATILALIGTIYELVKSLGDGNSFEIYIWSTGAVNTFLFLIGTIYFVAGTLYSMKEM